MTNMKLLYVLVTILATVLCEPVENPFIPGDLPVNHTSFLGVLTSHLDTNLDVYAPNAPGNFPVLYFIVGLGGIIPGIAYSEVLSHVASQGIIVTAVWKVGSPLDSFNSTWMSETVDFVENYLENRLHNHGYDSEFHVDYQNSFLAGHSAGAHVVVAALQAHCLNYRGLILLNPVDGVDPFGLIPIFVITPGEKVNFNIPTLEIMAGLDFVPGSGNPGAPACAPEELSGFRFFDAMQGPTWLLNATAFGHGDFLDDTYIEIIEATHFCASDPSSDKDQYRNFIAGEMVSFMKGIVDDCSMLEYLENNPTDVDTTFQFESNGVEVCQPTNCIWTEPNY